MNNEFTSPHSYESCTQSAQEEGETSSSLSDYDQTCTQGGEVTLPSCSYSQQTYTQPDQGAGVSYPAALSYYDQTYMQPDQGAGVSAPAALSYYDQTYTQPDQGAGVSAPAALSYYDQTYTQPYQGVGANLPSCSYSQQTYTQPNQGGESASSSLSYYDQTYTQPYQGVGANLPSCSYSQQAYTQPDQGAGASAPAALSYYDQTYTQPYQRREAPPPPRSNYGHKTYTKPYQRREVTPPLCSNNGQKVHTKPNQVDETTHSTPPCSNYGEQPYTHQTDREEETSTHSVPHSHKTHAQTGKVVEEPSSTLNKLLSIIDENENKRCGVMERGIYKTSPSDMNRIPSYKRWRLEIDLQFRSLISELLGFFAQKLVKLPFGSPTEKELFFRIMSESFATRPFVNAKNVLIRFIDNHVESKVRNLVKMEERDSITVSEINSITVPIIPRTKGREIGKLREYISRQIRCFYKETYKKYAEEELKDLKSSIDPSVFDAFLSLYNDFMKDQDKLITSKSIDMFFSSVVQNKECVTSFIFSTFLGHMIFYETSNKLLLILNSTTNNLLTSLEKLLPPKKCLENFCKPKTSTEEIDKFISQSKDLLKENISNFLLQNRPVLLASNEVNDYERDFVGKIVASSLEHLTRKLTSCIDGK
ncbi:hypothetical protein [Candidatus Ichthyocystis sparus]|uniref:hypothetical protein n=1 Tax=Candidatus Ichthyocystis sparus TaxID=1561004 RepID=UPI000AE38298|nr:hypothetical protein [Candidatus Ichthyocystis sparus]